MTQPRTSSSARRTRRPDHGEAPSAANTATEETTDQRAASVPLLAPAVGHLPVPSVRVTHVQLPRRPHVTVPVPHVEVPAAARRSVQGRRGMLLWWAGLAGAAAVGVLEWPVAAAVGVGTYVAERVSRAEDEPLITAPQVDRSQKAEDGAKSGD